MRHLFMLLLALNSLPSFSQLYPRQPGASEIKLRIRKLNFLGSVLYVAAHPDDENTRAIAFLVNDQLAATAYLSMTRGDGGQNLIGPEFRDLLGLIRTQELLAARRIDGSQQFFTRANDFGFSKSAAETFEIWNKDEILSDVVRVMRQFQPDVILTRFPPTEKAGHGHHTASAVLAQEAFDLTNDPNYHPEQVKEFGTFQAKRVLLNTSPFFNTAINEKTPGIIIMNVGAYSPLLGKSSSEIAGASRTQHKSQGFGSPGRRGDANDFFEFVKGSRPTTTIFDSINTTWSRIKGADKIPGMVDKILKEFNGENPVASLPGIMAVRNEISTLSSSIWRERKMKEVNELIKDCLGLYIDVTANNYWNTPGEEIVSSFEIINRSYAGLKLENISSPLLQYDTTLSMELKNNTLINFKSKRTLSNSATWSDPYWLRTPHTQGLFIVPDPSFIGKPENDPAINFTFNFQLTGGNYSLTVPLKYKWTDPVKGEQIRPAEIVPPVFVNLIKSVFLFRDKNPEDVAVVVRSASNSAQHGNLSLDLPSGWKSEPATYPFQLMKRDDEQYFHFKVLPGTEQINSTLQAFAEVDGKRFDKSIKTIQYDHIPAQTLLPTASAKVLKMELKKEGSVIAYIQGAGDDVADDLRNMGYEVWEMKDEEITPTNLKKVDAVVLGIRALNVNERIRYFMPSLLNYVKDGGTMVVQYNNNQGLKIDPTQFSPYPITLSRDRVTEENSEVRILETGNPLLNFPNKIVASDFDHWVQERGLYYPSGWDSHYTALLSSNDQGEKPKDGGLLVASYGKGLYIYTGLSFFRQLPEGVPGAYKLFANLVSASTKAKKK
jgi:LmbE family N-acetylglucosaminyl deacetylase